MPRRGASKRRGLYQQRSHNPFGLTDREREAVAALVRLGSDKAVAHELEIDRSAAARLLINAQRRMQANGRVAMALKWDRMHRGLAVGVASSVFALAEQRA